MEFYLIQRGNFNNDGDTLFGKNGVVNLQYMGYAEFEFDALPNSYNRIIDNLDKYVYIKTGIYTKDNDELILFVNQQSSKEILEALVSFINDPYHLKAYSELEKIPKSSIKDTFYDRMDTDFWWCIEKNQDWMAFKNSNRELFERGIINDYYKNKSKKLKTIKKLLKIGGIDNDICRSKKFL